MKIFDHDNRYCLKYSKVQMETGFVSSLTEPKGNFLAMDATLFIQSHLPFLAD